MKPKFCTVPGSFLTSCHDRLVGDQPKSALVSFRLMGQEACLFCCYCGMEQSQVSGTAPSIPIVMRLIKYTQTTREDGRKGVGVGEGWGRLVFFSFFFQWSEWVWTTVFANAHVKCPFPLCILLFIVINIIYIFRYSFQNVIVDISIVVKLRLKLNKWVRPFGCLTYIKFLSFFVCVRACAGICRNPRHTSCVNMMN